MKRKLTTRDRVVLVAVSPLLLLGLVLLLLFLPFYWIYRVLVRIVVEVLWGSRGRRVLLVYSRSPIWQEYVEKQWLPVLRDHAIIVNWSDRATWSRRKSFASWVFGVWKPSDNFNPMAILIPRFAPIRRIGFYYAFRDWKHGKETALQRAESELFAFVRKLRDRTA
jgi:hypothetical protein